MMGKKAFHRTKIPGARYVINQYIGCQHACKYCYARFLCKWYNYGHWGEWIIVRKNLPELVKMEKVKGSIYMSSISDPYQPIERDFKLTQRILKNMNKKARLSILTKSSLIVRDIDIIKEFEFIEVGLTINGFEEKVRKEIEPNASKNQESAFYV